jgi:hypothetical protein
VVCNIQHENSFLLFKKYYDNCCYRGGKANDHYCLSNLTTVHVFHSSRLFVYVHACGVCVCKYPENVIGFI